MQTSIKRALISVSDKTGLGDFAKGLRELGVELISTSGTAKFLKEAGLPVRDLSSLTNFPEILEGRVKTLHPKVHGGILFKRDDKEHTKTVEELGIEPIDMVVVNLYPFRETAAKAKESFAPEVIENIDIGGPSMVRSAAKNFKDVAIICRPQDYEAVLKELKETKNLSYQTRQKLCVEAFSHTASYDAAIATEFQKGLGIKYPETKIIALEKLQSLRYGENPHQAAALYTQSHGFAFEQLHGKELSYNNILDAFGTWDNVNEFEVPACVIFKHITPCGIGTGADIKEAFENAWRSDPKSAYGGIIAFNRPLNGETAELIKSFFVEAICAPDFDEQALEILQKKKNLRLLKRKTPISSRPLLKSIGDEVLLQDPNQILFKEALICPTKRQPTKEEETALKFAWACVKHIKSNAIVLTSKNATIGIGAGQMSRVDAVKMAGIKYSEYQETNAKPSLLVLASDAFFPFRDGVDLAAEFGISAIINPGGSIRDEEVIKACDEHNIAMLFTGIRHFRH
ncbi:MAG: bifunctional phosphoribosylaminoimidazolecarboxamide formyltransferase/IMP cyclohydrolase [Elusimicrobiota bacterium]|jgi:phosphoribosylaminoimidazolecarboxamide formyltransferase/IMP cyclohydrolase|nr:bifunctional phosphoribosylaminoimidazolecarboxamide formyltransferase/IMP cyclohydrolase [Elusimicrobiota bacterium]